ncbi:hypothetical protein ACA910_019759 [Epithemia clementina (nom. ined.)]
MDATTTAISPLDHDQNDLTFLVMIPVIIGLAFWAHSRHQKRSRRNNDGNKSNNDKGSTTATDGVLVVDETEESQSSVTMGNEGGDDKYFRPIRI